MEIRTKHCPYCDEEIMFDAKKCKHCGEWLTEEDRMVNEPLPPKKGYIIGALVGGIIAAAICTILWILVVGLTAYEHSAYALVVGIIVGFAVRWTGRGETTWFGIMASICAIISCFLGEFLSGVEIDFLSILYYVVAAMEAYYMARNQPRQ